MSTDVQTSCNMDNNAMNRRRFLKMMGEAGVFAGAFMAGGRNAVAGPGAPLFPELEKVGEKYSFAIIADPQVNRPDFPHAIYQTTQRKFSMIVKELNQADPQPAFVVIDGDLVSQVGVPKRGPEQIENFISRVRPLKPTTILVHGNHDGHEPWTEFKHMQKSVNGTEAVWFSWDVGKWHYIGIPAYLDTEESQQNFFEWLAQDLKMNRTRPTMAFVHWHLMPGFRTQHQWYRFDKHLLIRVMDLITKYGNVRYMFFGHVHNGIKVTAKRAWEYKGTKFITVPTCIAPRNFGEEFPEYASGEGEAPKSGDTGGGYYAIVDVDGEDATVRCRLVGNKQDYVLTKYTPYKDNEPLWFKNATDLKVNPKLVNGSFESGLDGWMRSCRYICDVNSGFVVETSPNPSGKGTCAVVQVRETGQRWGSREVMEIYQMVSLPSHGAVFKASYYMDKISNNGGGFIRLCLYSGSKLRVMILFDWSSKGDNTSSMKTSQHTIWMATGKKSRKADKTFKSASWITSGELEKWHQLQVDTKAVCDVLTGKKGAFSALGMDRMLVGAGTWCDYSEPGSIYRIMFDDFKLDTSDKSAESGILFNGDPLPVISEDSKGESGNQAKARKRSRSSKTR